MEEENKGHYNIYTFEYKLIQEYTGLNFKQIDKLEVTTYKLYLHDAFIYKYSQTEKGREYLENAWILEQTRPDRKKLRQHFSKGE